MLSLLVHVSSRIVSLMHTGCGARSLSVRQQPRPTLMPPASQPSCGQQQQQVGVWCLVCVFVFVCAGEGGFPCNDDSVCLTNSTDKSVWQWLCLQWVWEHVAVFCDVLPRHTSSTATACCLAGRWVSSRVQQVTHLWCGGTILVFRSFVLMLLAPETALSVGGTGLIGRSCQAITR